MEYRRAASIVPPEAYPIGSRVRVRYDLKAKRGSWLRIIGTSPQGVSLDLARTGKTLELTFNAGRYTDPFGFEFFLG